VGGFPIVDEIFLSARDSFIQEDSQDDMTSVHSVLQPPGKWVIIPVLFLSLTCCRAAASDTLLNLAGQSRAEVIRPETTMGLQAFFQTLDYNWAQLEKGVPPFILEGIPSDLNGSVSTTDKKISFFMGLLPMILLANQEIARERDTILQILARHKATGTRPGDLKRLETIMARYGLRGNPFTDHRTRSRLLRRVDTIPPSLVLAQAANESAWGSSRFAQLGNNLFGEWTYKSGTGIVPEGRPYGETYEVRKFPSIYASIRSYMNNLNRNGAYAKLRRIRENLRKAKQPLTGIALALGLQNYSERGAEYIYEIQAMIRQNELSRTNSVSLRRPPVKEILTTISTAGSGLFSTRNRMIGHLANVWSNP
jgi:Bax protein